MLTQLITQKKVAIASRWFDLVVATYPPDSRKFLARANDRFSNPVGHTISRSIEALLDELISEMNPDNICATLDDIIRIRAVQDFSSSDAIGFIFSLKRAVRDELVKDIQNGDMSEELFDFDCRIDRMALLAFKVYMECREKVYEIKANELRNRSGAMIERINKKYAGAD